MLSRAGPLPSGSGWSFELDGELVGWKGELALFQMTHM
jgi:hypothetical protein